MSVPYRIPTLILCCILPSLAISETEYPQGKVTVSVVDEVGHPISNATASVVFSTNIPKGEGWGTRPFAVEGNTDTNGLFTAEARGNPYLHYGARKPGYYETANLTYSFTNAAQGLWHPLNPTLSVVLKSVGSPVPMYAKRVTGHFPEIGKPVAYDLERGDWVKPFGDGVTSDLIFTLDRTIAAKNDFRVVLTLTFANEKDGIQSLPPPEESGSCLRMPREVPASGYESTLSQEIVRDPIQGFQAHKVDSRSGLAFRVRTELDEDGNVDKALYGWIASGFRLQGYLAESPSVAFSYYFNPSGERTVEFDPTQNLFKSLAKHERITER